MDRIDLEVIGEWIAAKSRVLDLGCGKGELLKSLQENKHVSGYGLEIDPDNIAECVKSGVPVIEQNMDEGLSNFSDNSFDAVIMTHALQAVHYPDRILDEMLRIGRECIITFPNFGHWRCRWYLATKGKMPVSKFMPYTWYNTPNIHFCTFHDFEALCKDKGLKILDRTVVGANNRTNSLMRAWPNLFGSTAIYRVSR